MYVVFIVGIGRTENFAACVAVSVLIHYFTLAAVTWMMATCTFIFWIMVVNPFAKSKFNSCNMLLITLLCWGKQCEALEEKLLQWLGLGVDIYTLHCLFYCIVYTSLLFTGIPMIPVIIPVAINRDLVVGYSSDNPSELQL